MQKKKNTKSKINKPVATQQPFPEINFFEKLTGNKGMYFLIFLLFVIVLVVFRDYLFFNNVYLFKDIGSDTINVFYPQYIHIASYLRQDGIPKWSFNQGMGQNIFPFSLGDPFNYLLYITGKDQLAYAIIYVEVLKIFLGGIFFYLYLKELSFSNFTAIIGGLLFSFSGYMILGGGWYVFSTEAVYASLLLLALEKYLKYNSWVLLCIAFALIAGFQPFYLFLYGVFILIYLFVRFIDIKGFHFRHLTIFFLRLSGIGILGVAISAVFFLPDCLQLMESPRASGNVSFMSRLSSNPVFSFADSMQNITSLLRLFSNDLIGTGSSFKGWSNYLEAPILYCGITTLLLVPQSFTVFNRKQKICYSLLLAFYVLPIVFPFFRQAFWLFTGDYYRTLSLLVVIVLLFTGLHALQFLSELKKINKWLLALTAVLLIVLISNPYFSLNQNYLNTAISSIVKFYIVLYAFLIYLLNSIKKRVYVQIIFLLAVCSELVYFASITTNNRPVISSGELKQKTGYNDFSVDAVAYVDSIDKSFFRVIKTYSSGLAEHTSMNDSKVQNYFGTASYHSFNQKFYIKFLEETGIIHGAEEETRWAPGLVSSPLLQSFGSVKYFFVKYSEQPKADLTGYDSLTTLGNVTVIRNKQCLPLGFSYNKYILENDFKKISNEKKYITLLKAFVIKDSEKELYKDFDQFYLKDTSYSYSWENYWQDIDSLRKDTLKMTLHSQNVITGKINLSRKKFLFFSIPFDVGWKGKLDGHEIALKLVNIGFMGTTIPGGDHLIELEYEPPLLKTGSLISFVSITIFGVLIWITNKKFRKKEAFN